MTQAVEENNRAVDGSAEVMEGFGEEVQGTADGISQLAGALAATGIAKGVQEIADALYSCVDSFAEFDAQMSAVQSMPPRRTSQEVMKRLVPATNILWSPVWRPGAAARDNDTSSQPPKD